MILELANDRLEASSLRFRKARKKHTREAALHDQAMREAAKASGVPPTVDVKTVDGYWIYSGERPVVAEPSEEDEPDAEPPEDDEPEEEEPEEEEPEEEEPEDDEPEEAEPAATEQKVAASTDDNNEENTPEDEPPSS